MKCLNTAFLGILIAGLLSILACSDVPGPSSFASSTPPIRTVGYWENWNDVKWWDNNIPGNCHLGCIKDTFEAKIQPYTHVVYSFLLLQNDAVAKTSYNKIACKTAEDCPVWDGKGIYLSDVPLVGSGVPAASDISVEANLLRLKILSGNTTLKDFVTRAHQAKKIALLALGGWSDWVRIGTTENAETIAGLFAQLVTTTGADGVDLDFEHLAEFSKHNGPDSEYKNFSFLVVALRSKLGSDKIISYTTRFNAFGVTRDNLMSFANPTIAPNPNNPLPTQGYDPADTLKPFVPLTGVDADFITNNEGETLWLGGNGVLPIKDSVDMVNIMAYDAGTFLLDFAGIFNNFVGGGVPAGKISMGLEPGNQAAGGIWEGCAMDKDIIEYVSSKGGGVMFWAINAATATNAKYTNILASGSPCP